jgi:hypothetical protein
MDVMVSLHIVLDKLRESMSRRASTNTIPKELLAASQSLLEVKYDNHGRKLKVVSKKDINYFEGWR